MKGIILAGGLGTRLYPLTKITNKHLLPLYNKPMIYYPIESMIKSGITDIILVTGGNNSGDFLRLLGDGSELGLRRLQYIYQNREGGIAHALSLCEKHTEGQKIAVILGDNIFACSISKSAREFEKSSYGAKIFLKKVANPSEYGVARFSRKKLVGIVEKARRPPSSMAVVGIYLYDNTIFTLINTLQPSKRNELEITDVNNIYLRQKRLTYGILKGGWSDAGESIEAYNKAVDFARKLCKRPNIKLSI